MPSFEEVRRCFTLAISAVVMLVLASCVTSKSSPVGSARDMLQSAYFAALQAPKDQAALDVLWAALITAGQCDNLAAICFVDGDLALTREGLAAEMSYRAAAASAAQDKSASSKELSLNHYKNTKDYWPKHLRKLTYFIDSKSFSNSPAGSDAVGIVRKALHSAINDWLNACSSHICKLKYEETLDPDAAVFHVRYNSDPKFGYYGYAPFPQVMLTADRKELNPDRFNSENVGKGAHLWVGEMFFGCYSSRCQIKEGYGKSWKVGDTLFLIPQTFVMRHELGHLLGYRHEFVVGVPLGVSGFDGCEVRQKREQNADLSTENSSHLVDEAANAVADIYSVMMLPCARYYADSARNEGRAEYDYDLKLSTCDRELHAALYGEAPLEKCTKY